MKRLILLGITISVTLFATAQKKEPLLKGMYLQWGYNTEWYTKSNINFELPDGSNFTLHHAKAKDRPDLDAIVEQPLDISIPQYNYRIGFYLKADRSRAIELNFDHAKYIVTDGQTVYVSGTINGKPVAGDSVLNPDTFLHFEHTDGANWLHVNYVVKENLILKKKSSLPLFSLMLKAGAGINIPRTDFTWKGDKFNNDFHVAGYNISIESGFRYYPLKNLFLEAIAKTGYVRYINALSNSQSLKGVRAHHGFGYFELIGLIGYDIKF